MLCGLFFTIIQNNNIGCRTFIKIEPLEKQEPVRTNMSIAVFKGAILSCRERFLKIVVPISDKNDHLEMVLYVTSAVKPLLKAATGRLLRAQR